MKKLKAKSGSPRNDRIALLATKGGGQNRYYGYQQNVTFSGRRDAIRIVNTKADWSGDPDAQTLADSIILAPSEGRDAIGQCLNMRNRFISNTDRIKKIKRAQDDFEKEQESTSSKAKEGGKNNSSKQQNKSDYTRLRTH